MAIDNGGGNQDHRNLHDRIFSVVRPKNFLEFGLGIGTLYFLDKCDRVISFEVLVNPTQEGWTEEVVKLIGDNPNYKAIDFPHEDKFTDELKIEISKLLGEVKPDFVFVDSGCHCRADIINLCFEYNIPSITAHDTNHGMEAYGWGKVNPLSEYKTIRDTNGEGTTLWTKDQLLIANL
jgi:hypothetical protein